MKNNINTPIYYGISNMPNLIFSLDNSINRLKSKTNIENVYFNQEQIKDLSLIKSTAGCVGGDKNKLFESLPGSSSGSASYLGKRYESEKLNNVFLEKNKISETINSKKSGYVNELYSLIKSENFIEGFESKSEVLFKQILEMSKDIGMQVLLEINLMAIKDKDYSVINGILFVIAHFSYEEMYPVGQTIALASLNIPVNEIIESAIMVYDYWDHKDGASILSGIDCRNEWIENYKNKVISELLKK